MAPGLVPGRRQLDGFIKRLDGLIVFALVAEGYAQEVPGECSPWIVLHILAALSHNGQYSSQNPANAHINPHLNPK